MYWDDVLLCCLVGWITWNVLMVHPVPVITDQPLFTVGFPTFHHLLTGAVIWFCILRLLLSRKNTLMVQYQREQKAKVNLLLLSLPKVTLFYMYKYLNENLKIMVLFCSKTLYWCSETTDKCLWPQMARIEMDYYLKMMGHCQCFQVLWWSLAKMVKAYVLLSLWKFTW